MKTYRQRAARIQQKKEEWEKEKILLQEEYNLKQEKKLFKQKQKKKWFDKLSKIKKPNTSKMLILFLFINCTLIELFSCGIIIYALTLSKTTMLAVDFSPLTALIGAIVTEVIGYAVYSIKSMKENTKGGITYETAILNGGQDKNNEQNEQNN